MVLWCRSRFLLVPLERGLVREVAGRVRIGVAIAGVLSGV